MELPESDDQGDAGGQRSKEKEKSKRTEAALPPLAS